MIYAARGPREIVVSRGAVSPPRHLPHWDKNIWPGPRHAKDKGIYLKLTLPFYCVHTGPAQAACHVGAQMYETLPSDQGLNYLHLKIFSPVGQAE